MPNVDHSNNQNSSPTREHRSCNPCTAQCCGPLNPIPLIIYIWLFTKQCYSKYIIIIHEFYGKQQGIQTTNVMEWPQQSNATTIVFLPGHTHSHQFIFFINKKTKNNSRGEMRTSFYDLLLRTLYMLVEMASTLVTTASIIIISAIILSLFVDIPYASRKTIEPGKMKARHTADDDPRN